MRVLEPSAQPVAAAFHSSEFRQRSRPNVSSQVANTCPATEQQTGSDTLSFAAPSKPDKSPPFPSTSTYTTPSTSPLPLNIPKRSFSILAALINPSCLSSIMEGNDHRSKRPKLQSRIFACPDVPPHCLHKRENIPREYPREYNNTNCPVAGKILISARCRHA